MSTASSTRRAPRVRRSASASTLAATMMVVAGIVAFLAISVLMTSQFGRYAGRQSGDSDEMAACDAALDYAYTQWKTTTYNAVHGLTGTVPAASACYPLNGSATTPGTPAAPNKMAQNFNTYYGSTFAASSGATCFNLQILATDQNGQPASYDTNGEPVFASAGSPTAITTQNVPGYPGWSGTTSYYAAVAGVTAPGRFGNPKPVSAVRYFQVTKVPLFQAAIFYENKLELHPGAPMVVTGLVHSNADIWARGYFQLQFKSNVSSVGSFNEIGDVSVYHGFDGSNMGWIFGVNANGYDLTGMTPVTWANGKSTAQDSTRDGQYNQVSAINPFGAGTTTSNNGLHDIVEIPPTPPAGTPPNDQIAYNNASLRIIIDDTQTPTISTTVTVGKVTTTTVTPNPAYITMYDRTNKVIPFSTTAGSDYNNVYLALSSYPTSSTTTNPGSTGVVQTIQDLREMSTVTVTSVDMSKLAAATTASGSAVATNFSGTVYIHYLPRLGTVTSPNLTSTQRDAVRLYNGRNLGQPVTVATDNGLYIQGDYNTGGTVYTDVPSNTSSGGAPQYGSYPRYASSVLADAVTILSNNWLDINSNSALASRQAQVTTVNTAILSGDVASNDPRYPGTGSGGAHNFPRFLENWGNINFTYTGSLVEAFHSETYIGKWTTGNVYNWPNRPWSFDVNFLTKQPPGIPSGLQFSRGRWQRISVASSN